MNHSLLTYGAVDLRYGYFYNICIAELEELAAGERNGAVISGAPSNAFPPRCEVMEAKNDASRRHCAIDEKHWADDELVAVGIDIFGGGDDMLSFLQNMEYKLLGKSIADHIRRTSLKGYHLHHVKNVTIFGDKPGVNVDLPGCDQVYQLQFLGRRPFMPMRIEPAERNRCPSCGHAPLICPECGYFEIDCTKCSERWLAARDAAPKGRKCLITNGIPPAHPPIVDPDRWDGGDFFGSLRSGWVTRRVVDFLAAIHAYPFVALPIPVNVAGITKETRAKLEKAKLPVDNS